MEVPVSSGGSSLGSPLASSVFLAQFWSMERPDEAMKKLLSGSGTRFDGWGAGNTRLSPADIILALAPQLSEERMERIDQILDGRTYDIAPVVEGVINTGNVSAVMRTSEGLGFQSFHVIRNDAPFKHSTRTTQGAQKWLDVHLWDTTPRCVDHLKAKGYTVVVTALTDTAVPLEDVDFTRKTALVFGNEAHGCSQTMLERADQTCILPSPGFVQSYNISVAAAMSLYAAFASRVRILGANGNLSQTDKERLRADFYFRSVRSAETILERWADTR